MRTRLLPALAVLFAAAFAFGYPQPSPYPISWELTFDHGVPKRIAVEIPGQPQPQAYYYMTYTIINDTDREQTFLPVFTLVTKEGEAIRSDRASR